MKKLIIPLILGLILSVNLVLAEAPLKSNQLSSSTPTSGYILSTSGHINTWIDMATINVKSFGAKGDGVTDDSVAIQEAINAAEAAGGGTVIIPAGTYVASSTLTIDSSNITILANNAVIKTGVGSLETALNITGSIGNDLSILDSITAGTTTLTLSPSNAATLVAGDYLRILSNELYFSMVGRTYYKGEMVKVKSVDMDTGVVIIENNGFILDYATTTYNPVASKISFINNIKIDGLEIAGTGTNNRQVGINFKRVKNFLVSGGGIKDVEVGYATTDSIFGGIKNVYLYNINRSPTGYGVSLEGVSNNIEVQGVRGDNNRHTFTTGGGNGVVMMINVHDNFITHNTSAGLNAHGNARFVTFHDNTIKNSFGGVSTYSPHTIIKNNKITNVETYGISGVEAGGINQIITGNIIEKSSVGYFSAIYLDVTATEAETNNFIVINDNLVTGAQNGGGILVYDDVNADTVDVSNNSMKDIGYTFISVQSGNKIKINNNILNNLIRYSTPGNYGISASTSDFAFPSVDVSNNFIYKAYVGIKILNPTNASVIGNTLLLILSDEYDIVSMFLRASSNYPSTDSEPITNLNSNLGIGTASTIPYGKLTIQSAESLTKLLIHNDTVAGSVAGIWFKSATNYADAYQKAAIAFVSDGSAGANGDLQFLTTDRGNSPNVATGTDAKMTIKADGSVGIGTTTPLANLQVTTSSANATTSIQFGKTNQNKGTCLTYYDTAGTPVYGYINAGETTFTYTLSKPSGCQN